MSKYANFMTKSMCPILREVGSSELNDIALKGIKGKKGIENRFADLMDRH